MRAWVRGGPLKRDLVARKEFADFVRLPRPAGAEEAQSFENRPIVCLRFFEKIAGHGIEVALRGPRVSKGSDLGGLR